MAFSQLEGNASQSALLKSNELSHLFYSVKHSRAFQKTRNNRGWPGRLVIHHSFLQEQISKTGKYEKTRRVSKRLINQPDRKHWFELVLEGLLDEKYLCLLKSRSYYYYHYYSVVATRCPPWFLFLFVSINEDFFYYSTPSCCQVINNKIPFHLLLNLLRLI